MRILCFKPELINNACNSKTLKCLLDMTYDFATNVFIFVLRMFVDLRKYLNIRKELNDMCTKLIGIKQTSDTV